MSLGVAALFKNCIECFELFKTASDFERKYELLLVKLEIEQERLLVWGDVVGLGERQRDIAAVLDGKESIVRRGLGNISKILEDTDFLQSRYGVQRATLDGPIRDSKGLTASALKRFRLRFGREGPGVIKRAQWAISDASKFETLVRDIRELITGLTAIIPAETHTQKIEDDIANLVDDLETLEILSEACEDEYPSLHKAASLAIDASEHGTYTARLSTRADTMPFSDARVPPRPALLQDGPIQADNDQNQVLPIEKVQMDRLDKRTKVFFVLTEPCLRIETKTPCDQSALGDQLLSKPEYHFTSQDPNNFHSRPGYIMRSQIDYKSESSYTSDQLDEMLFRLRDLEARSALSNGKIKAPKMELKYTRIYIYCAPCTCQIQLALKSNFTFKTDWWIYVTKTIRVDYRLTSSCCIDRPNRINAAISLMQDIRKNPGDNIYNFLDSNYLDTQIYDYAEDTRPLSPAELVQSILDEHKNQPGVDAIVVQGETDYTAPLLKAQPFPLTEFRLPPSNNQIFMMYRDNSQLATGQSAPPWKRRYAGSFAPHVRDEK